MIGIIGGGNMGEAIIKGMIDSGNFKPSNIYVFDVVKDKLIYLTERYRISFVESIEDIVKKVDTIILAVKPQVINKVAASISPFINKDKHLIISIAAGITIKSLENGFGDDKRIVRVMPNTPAFILESLSALSFNKNINEQDRVLTLKIFESIGKVIEIEEAYLNAITAVSGSGPGYIALILEAFSDAAVKIGLPRDIADTLILQTFKGTIKLVEEKKLGFIEAKNMVTSPGGTTIAGIHELEKGALKATIMNCVEAAFEKAKNLGQ